MNCVQLIGRVENEPELRHTTGSGQAVVNLVLATTEVFNDKEGKRQRRTERHRLVCWGSLADFVEKEVFRRDWLGVEGKLQTRQSVDRVSGRPRYAVEVTVTRVHLFGDDYEEENHESNKD